jgi:hypothetical protein
MMKINDPLFNIGEVCKAGNLTLECESPLEISLAVDPTSRATGQFASDILDNIKREMIKNYKHHEGDKGGLRELKHPFTHYTCAACTYCRTCDWAFDEDNIKGHCVVEDATDYEEPDQRYGTTL